ncbi:hypothetical protein M9H77_34861 [Catharanthus roseus]|uniref:Uncharacterized protein n=1 Tax=Catharanthus roseus TaxID=4058 RepID=A0ACB9ZNL4_CATRO|nr:hypothetical protein M9H77_34861 [Catharanthus roseus]
MTMTKMKKKYRHNHKIGVYSHAHAQMARLTDNQLKLTEELSRCQVAPWNIMASFKDEEEEDGGTYNMLLLEAIRMTPTGKTFTVATLFMRNKKVKTYEWVLQQLKNLYFESPEPTTNQADSEHSLLKAWITTRHGDLDTVFLTIDYLIEEKITEI